MRVGFGDLTIWSFLMSTAHGAGLMLVPVLLGMETESHAHAHHAHHVHDHALALASMAAPSAELAALLVHTLAMFVVTAVTALVVCEKVGLRLLRSAWLNLDHLWTGAILGAGLLTLLFMG